MAMPVGFWQRSPDPPRITVPEIVPLPTVFGGCWRLKKNRKPSIPNGFERPRLPLERFPS